MTVEEEELTASDGRVPGRRGRATRRRLLDCTAGLLQANGYRDLRVVDVAREAGTSPATFYQYFPDVESAVLALGEDIMDDAAELASAVAAGWSDDPTRMADVLVEEFLGFWDRHRAVLSVIDLLALHGDDRFREQRSRALNAITEVLRGVLDEARGDGRLSDDVDAMATAGVMVAMLAHVASHRSGFEAWGVGRDGLRAAMARVVALSVGAGSS